MKKLFISLSAAAAILAGCAQENEYTPSEKTHTLTVEVADEATKTYTEGGKIYWNGIGEQLNIIYFADESTTRRQSATHTDYKVVDNKATFTADFTPTDGAEKYTFGAFYPYAYKYSTSSINLIVPQEQTPTATSYDPKADILVSAQPVVTSGLPDKIQFQLVRMVAFAQMTIKGIPEGELINKVIISSPAKPAGAVEFKVHEANTLENAKWYYNYEDITLNMGGRIATGNDDVWFVTVPTDLSGKDLTVKVSTDKNDYIKTIDLTGKTLTFERANIAKFSVAGLTKVEKPKSYKLLTDASELTPGDQMVICTKNTASSTAKFLGIEADGSAIKFSSSGTILDGPEIIEIPADARIFIVENGVDAGTLSFKASDGYLYGNYDSENCSSKLWVKDTKDVEASWTLSLLSSYAATLYNETHGRYLNNYYGSKFNFAGSQGTYYYYIYYIDGESDAPEQPEQPATTPLETPVVTATAAGNTVSATWAAVQGAKDYTVTCGSQISTVTETTATFADLDYATEYTVSVVANPADAAANTVSEAGSVKVTTEAAPAGESQTVTITFPVTGTTLNLGSYFYENSEIGISASGTGWRTKSPDEYNGLFMGSDKELKITSINKGAVITKVIINNVDGKSIALSYTACNDNPYSKTTGTYNNTAWEGSIDNYITFKATSASFIASITVEYR